MNASQFLHIFKNEQDDLYISFNNIIINKIIENTKCSGKYIPSLYIRNQVSSFILLRIFDNEAWNVKGNVYRGKNEKDSFYRKWNKNFPQIRFILMIISKIFHTVCSYNKTILYTVIPYAEEYYWERKHNAFRIVFQYTISIRIHENVGKYFLFSWMKWTIFEIKYTIIQRVAREIKLYSTK